MMNAMEATKSFAAPISQNTSSLFPIALPSVPANASMRKHWVSCILPQ